MITGCLLLFIIFRDLLTYVAGQARPRGIMIVMRTEAKILHIRVEHDGVEVSDGGEPSASRCSASGNVWIGSAGPWRWKQHRAKVR